MKFAAFALIFMMMLPAYGKDCHGNCPPPEPPKKMKLKDKDSNLIPWLIIGAVVGVSIAYSWDAKEKGQEPVTMKFDAFAEGGLQ